MSVQLSEFDRLLLDAIQRSVPLVARPFAQLAAELGAEELDVLARVEALSAPEGVIRRISGLFDAAALGYDTTLAAARVSADRLDAAGAIVAEHPGVSHCYGREGPLNLWFTLAIGPGSSLGLPLTLEILRRTIGAERMLSLPTIRRYKLDVRFPMSGAPIPKRTHTPAVAARSSRPEPPSDEQVRAIEALQTPLPAIREPFAELARAADMDAATLLVHAGDLLSAGWMRRYGAVLRHRRAGAAVNVLVAWRVPDDHADAFGRQAAEFAAVSHCYLRAASEGWPYNVYTMIHGPDERAVGRTLDALVAAGGDVPRIELPTAREYKKATVRLFSAELHQWETEAAE